MKKPKQRRSIGGSWFYLAALTRSKSQAEGEAEYWRDHGFAARVVKLPKNEIPSRELEGGQPWGKPLHLQTIRAHDDHRSPIKGTKYFSLYPWQKWAVYARPKKLKNPTKGPIFEQRRRDKDRARLRRYLGQFE